MPGIRRRLPEKTPSGVSRGTFEQGAMPGTRSGLPGRTPLVLPARTFE
ncbi:MAG: hypothetical protein LBG81_06875 [Coriobacteriaceae bacterium]|nr:hypothetical protein [Coriobacteriaceae bacterium]